MFNSRRCTKSTALNCIFHYIFTHVSEGMFAIASRISPFGSIVFGLLKYILFLRKPHMKKSGPVKSHVREKREILGINIRMPHHRCYIFLTQKCNFDKNFQLNLVKLQNTNYTSEITNIHININHPQLKCLVLRYAFGMNLRTFSYLC